MSALSKRAAEVERELGAEWTRYHVGAQAARFAAGVFVALLLSLHNGLGDWTSLLPLLAGAVWTTAAQMWPQVPWSLIRDRFGAEKTAPTTASAPASAPAAVAPGADAPPPAKG